MNNPVEARILEDLTQSLALAAEVGPGDFEWEQLTPHSAFQVLELDEDGKVVHVHYVSIQINPGPKEPTHEQPQ